jgi:hypothetical protein
MWSIRHAAAIAASRHNVRHMHSNVMTLPTKLDTKVDPQQLRPVLPQEDAHIKKEAAAVGAANAETAEAADSPSMLFRFVPLYCEHAAVAVFGACPGALVGLCIGVLAQRGAEHVLNSSDFLQLAQADYLVKGGAAYGAGRGFALGLELFGKSKTHRRVGGLLVAGIALGAVQLLDARPMKLQAPVHAPNPVDPVDDTATSWQ